MTRASVSQRKSFAFSIAALGLLGLSFQFMVGCTQTIPLNYSPSSVLSATGAVTVSDFAYIPAVSGKVAPNQIKNTAVSNLYFDQNINVFLEMPCLRSCVSSA